MQTITENLHEHYSPGCAYIKKLVYVFAMYSDFSSCIKIMLFSHSAGPMAGSKR